MYLARYLKHTSKTAGDHVLVSTDQQDLRKPYCTFASPGAGHEITVVGYSRAHYEPMQIRTSQGLISRTRYVGPIAHFQCSTCGQQGRVDVGKDWTPPPETPEI